MERFDGINFGSDGAQLIDSRKIYCPFKQSIVNGGQPAPPPQAYHSPKHVRS